MGKELVIAEETARQVLYVVDYDERGVVYRRPTAAPIGAAGPVLAAHEEPAPMSLLGAPELIPLDWLERPPAWLEPGEGVRVVLDGPERGRSAGYIRLHETCYQDGTGACRIPPPVTYEAFHRGMARVIDADGQVREVAVGSIAIVGGHSSRGGAKAHTDAIEFIDQPEKTKLRGVLVEDETGLLFLGCARPDMTRAEAVMVNQSDTSGEWWPLYEKDDHGRVGLVGHDLVGIALVGGGAFRKSLPERFRVLAAALGRDLDDDEIAAMEAEMGDNAGTCGCGGSCCAEQDDWTDAVVRWKNQPVSASFGSSATGNVATIVYNGDPADLAARVGSRLLAAAGEDSKDDGTKGADLVAEFRTTLEDLSQKVDTLISDVSALQRDVIRMQVDQAGEDDILLPEITASNTTAIAETAKRVEQIEETLRLMAMRAQGMTSDGAGDNVPAGVAAVS